MNSLFHTTLSLSSCSIKIKKRNVLFIRGEIFLVLCLRIVPLFKVYLLLSYVLVNLRSLLKFLILVYLQQDSIFPLDINTNTEVTILRNLFNTFMSVFNLQPFTTGSKVFPRAMTYLQFFVNFSIVSSLSILNIQLKFSRLNSNSRYIFFCLSSIDFLKKLLTSISMYSQT